MSKKLCVPIVTLAISGAIFLCLLIQGCLKSEPLHLGFNEISKDVPYLHQDAQPVLLDDGKVLFVVSTEPKLFPSDPVAGMVLYNPTNNLFSVVEPTNSLVLLPKQRVKIGEKFYGTPNNFEYSPYLLPRQLREPLSKKLHIQSEYGPRLFSLSEKYILGLEYHNKSDEHGLTLPNGQQSTLLGKLYNSEKKSTHFLPPIQDPEILNASRITLMKDSRLLFTGGEDTKFIPSSRVWLYEPNKNVLIKKQNLLCPRSGHNALLLEEEKVLIAGGQSGSCFNAELYDLRINKSKPLNLNLDLTRATLIPLNGTKLLILKGDKSYIWDYKTGISSPASPMKHPRYSPNWVKLSNGDVLIFGGSGQSDSDKYWDNLLYPENEGWRVVSSVEVFKWRKPIQQNP